MSAEIYVLFAPTVVCISSWIKANKNKNKGEAKEQKGEKEITSAGLL